MDTSRAGFAGAPDSSGGGFGRGARPPSEQSAPSSARQSGRARSGSRNVFALVDFIGWLLSLYSWVIIAAALISWVSPDPRNPVVMFLRRATEPVLAPIRRLVPPWKTGGLDLSPLIVLIAIQFVERVVLPTLLRSLY